MTSDFSEGHTVILVVAIRDGRDKTRSQTGSAARRMHPASTVSPAQCLPAITSRCGVSVAFTVPEVILLESGLAFLS